MTLFNHIGVDLFAFVPLSLAINLSYKLKLENRNTKYFTHALLMMLQILLCEMLRAYFLFYPTTWSYIISNALLDINNITSVALPYTLLKVSTNLFHDKQTKLLIKLPFIMQFFISIFHFYIRTFPPVDFVSTYYLDHYFFYYALIPFGYYIFFVYLDIKKYFSYENKKQRFPLLLIFGSTLICVILQEMYPNYLITNAGLTSGLLLYMIFFFDLKLDYDLQTGVQNVNAFHADMSEIQLRKKDTTLFIFDVNNLKKMNDSRGHGEGDKLIERSALCIKEVFHFVGNAYRIGGDEFCVLSKYMEAAQAETFIDEFQAYVSQQNEVLEIPLSIAVGYSSTHLFQIRTKDIYKTFSEADENMYQHKKQEKKGRSC